MRKKLLKTEYYVHNNIIIIVLMYKLIIPTKTELNAKIIFVYKIEYNYLYDFIINK